MATPTFTFNNASGSDTAASGAGPVTALSGTSASYSGSVFTLDGSPDLSGVSTDGSHVIWVQTSTGRQFFTINAVDDGADTVTVDDAPAGTSTGLTWGLGGKRKTLDDSDSRLLFSADWKPGWIAELEDDQTVTSSAVTLLATENIRIQSSSEGTLRTVTQSANAACFAHGGTGAFAVTLKDIKLANSNGTKTSAYGFDSTNLAKLFALNCVFGDATNQLLCATDGTTTVYMRGCEITDCTSDGINITSRDAAFIDCWIHDNGGRGLNLNNTPFCAIGCIITDNTSDGIYCRPTDVKAIVGCVIDDNTGDGIDLTILTWCMPGYIGNNIITNNGGYGIRGSGTDQADCAGVRHNNFGTGGSANTSGDVLTIAKDSGNVNQDPQFSDAANDDYTTGANMKAAGDDGTIGINSGTDAFTDIGIQQEAAAGGGGGLLRANMSGGMFG